MAAAAAELYDRRRSSISLFHDNYSGCDVPPELPVYASPTLVQTVYRNTLDHTMCRTAKQPWRGARGTGRTGGAGGAGAFGRGQQLLGVIAS